MVSEALQLGKKNCKDFKCSFFPAKACISFTVNGISENNYKQRIPKLKWEGIFGLEVLTSLSGLHLHWRVKHRVESPLGSRWKLWRSPVHSVGNREGWKLVWRKSWRTCARRLAVSVQPWSSAVSGQPLWWHGEELSPTVPQRTRSSYSPPLLQWVLELELRQPL